jgi:indolepyruvate ferredoxin oxidoreductase, beta subunit
MKVFNIYLCGVGGQGIGLLSEILLRAVDYASFQAKAVDTHGLAQRGGVVISHLRFGDAVYSPMVPAGQADLVVALERHEALRGAETALKAGGTLIYYNTVLQPLGVRLGKDREVSEEAIQKYCDTANMKVIKVKNDELSDPKMQNIAVLAQINKQGLLPEVSEEHYLQAMDDLMTGNMLETNLQLFNSL